jgi:hypothetical protein
MVPVKGIEPSTFALRMRVITCLPSLIGVGIVYVNQHVKQESWFGHEVGVLIEMHLNTVLVPTWCLHGASDGTEEGGR